MPWIRLAHWRYFLKHYLSAQAAIKVDEGVLMPGNEPVQALVVAREGIAQRNTPEPERLKAVELFFEALAEPPLRGYTPYYDFHKDEEERFWQESWQATGGRKPEA